MISLAWLLPLLPLLAGLLGLACYRRASLSAGLAIAGNAASLGLGLLVLGAWLNEGSLVHSHSVEWFPLTAGLAIRLGVLLDPLSLMMAIVVSGIALPVSIYAVGYMRGDTSAGRFHPLLSLFVAAMLGLVLAPNLGQLFVCWELVGVTSYLLIGFWWHKPAAVAASKKAFVVTRFADAFFLGGLILVALGAGSLDFDQLLSPAAIAALVGVSGPFGIDLLALGTGMIFVGAWGKSAMFPLHIWLPDAMEGPTPVSSIIHSATMVVAGIFLVARLFPLMDAAGTLVLATVTGAFTACFAAAVACVQRDIKRILAFSTLSQLGYMMFALGISAGGQADGYMAGMFHVFTHAWFKCLLFLSAGLVIHAVHSNQLAVMGGLRRHLPVTWIVCLVACLAISGVPPFAGFYSKDAILAAALAADFHGLFFLALVTGGLTAFYMFRFFILIFHGVPRAEAEALAQVHEDRWMLTPMIALAVASVVAGFMAQGWFARHLLPPGSNGELAGHPWWLPLLATGVALIGIALAVWRYGRRPSFAALVGWHLALHQQLGSNAAWCWLLARLDGLATLSRSSDERAIDGSLNGLAACSQGLGAGLRALHNGSIARYLGVMVLALVVVLALTDAGSR